MDSSRLRTGEIVAGIGGVALFVFLFFDWFGGGAEVSGSLVNGTAVLSHPGISGWDALTDLPGFLIILSGISGIALAYLAAAGQRVNIPVRRGAVTALLGALAVLLILWRMFAGSPTLKIGVFLGLGSRDRHHGGRADGAWRGRFRAAGRGRGRPHASGLGIRACGDAATRSGRGSRQERPGLERLHHDQALESEEAGRALRVEVEVEGEVVELALQLDQEEVELIPLEEQQELLEPQEVAAGYPANQPSRSVGAGRDGRVHIPSPV